MSALHILQHSLGVDQYGQGEQYRNRFVTGPGSVDHPICMELVGKGLMTRRVAPEGYGGMDFFYVTEAGRQFVADNSPSPPRLTKAQRRYRAYLNSETSLSFIDWMRTWGRQVA